MTKPFIYFVLGLASLSLMLSGALTINYFNSKSKLKSKTEECIKTSDSLKSIIEERESEIDILQDEIQDREIEIMYWGMKYDSTTWSN